MTALLMPAPLEGVDTAKVTTPAVGTRVPPRRTARAVRRQQVDARKNADPRGWVDPRVAIEHRLPAARSHSNVGGYARAIVPVGDGSWACRLEVRKPRVTIAESAVAAPSVARDWQLTERGWAVVVLGVLLAFGSATAVVVAQFLAITAG